MPKHLPPSPVLPVREILLRRRPRRLSRQTRQARISAGGRTSNESTHELLGSLHDADTLIAAWAASYIRCNSARRQTSISKGRRADARGVSGLFVRTGPENARATAR